MQPKKKKKKNKRNQCNIVFGNFIVHAQINVSEY